MELLNRSTKRNRPLNVHIFDSAYGIETFPPEIKHFYYFIWILAIINITRITLIRIDLKSNRVTEKKPHGFNMQIKVRSRLVVEWLGVFSLPALIPIERISHFSRGQFFIDLTRLDSTYFFFSRIGNVTKTYPLKYHRYSPISLHYHCVM